MNDPNSFILLVLGAVLVYGLAPAFVPALVIIGLLWIIAAAPHLGAVIAIALAVVVLLKHRSNGSSNFSSADSRPDLGGGSRT